MSPGIDQKSYGRILAQLSPRPPQNAAEHDALVAELTKLDDIENPSPEQNATAELLTALVEHYENKTVVIAKNTPHESLTALMEDRGLRHKDIAAMVGNKGLTTEIIAGRREISKTVARKLADGLQVPIELFL
ncbi:MAG: hypothetical protein SGI92_33620 [Bryobacteraceae bacterium]|nr:hypothetical protein [Bryobacteraceae bacterium]